MTGPLTRERELVELTVHDKYKYALSRIEKTQKTNPGIAAIWKKEAEVLRDRLGEEE